jgi:tripeptidyl-peptidase I
MLSEISNPYHANYGQYLKRHQLKDMLRPTPEATAAVLDWLAHSGVAENDIDDKGDWINFVARIDQAEAMLRTKYYLYRSSVDHSTTKIRTLQYSVPRGLVDCIDMIQPTTRFGQTRPQFSLIRDKTILGQVGTIPIDSSCNVTITPTCLKELYNINGFMPSSNMNESGFIAVNGFLEEYAQHSDWAQFQPRFAPWAAGADFSWTSINGALPRGQIDGSVEISRHPRGCK